jgi:predicted kinase
MNFDITNLGSPDEEKKNGTKLQDDQVLIIVDAIEKECLDFSDITRSPFILIPTGLIASGKTTTVKALAEHYSLVVVRTDTIRAYLEKRGYNLTRTVEIAFHLILRVLQQGHGVAIDADIVQKEDRDAIVKLASELSLPIISVKINTPENVILERLDDNNTEREYRGEEAIKRYFERKHLHADQSISFDFVFKGDQELAPQLQAAIEVIDSKIQQNTPEN